VAVLWRLREALALKVCHKRIQKICLTILTFPCVSVWPVRNGVWRCLVSKVLAVHLQNASLPQLKALRIQAMNYLGCWAERLRLFLCLCEIREA
jgi:hypothetical protein